MMTASDKAKSANKNTITVIDNKNNQQLDLDIMSGTVGPDVIDVRKLYHDLNYFTYDQVIPPQPVATLQSLILMVKKAF